jgi:hypothetical protein
MVVRDGEMSERVECERTAFRSLSPAYTVGAPSDSRNSRVYESDKPMVASINEIVIANESRIFRT